MTIELDKPQIETLFDCWLVHLKDKTKAIQKTRENLGDMEDFKGLKIFDTLLEERKLK